MPPWLAPDSAVLGESRIRLPHAGYLRTAKRVSLPDILPQIDWFSGPDHKIIPSLAAAYSKILLGNAKFMVQCVDAQHTHADIGAT